MERTDNMLKVSGIYVSPIEVESSLVSHPAVLEAAVVGKADAEELVKPAAYVVLKGDRRPSDELAEELRQHVKSQLAPASIPAGSNSSTSCPRPPPERFSGSSFAREPRESGDAHNDLTPRLSNQATAGGVGKRWSVRSHGKWNYSPKARARYSTAKASWP